MITNTQAVRFANEKARTVADLVQSMHRTLDQFMIEVVTEFESQTGAAQNGDVIDDGSQLDGRGQVTKLNVAELKYVIEQLKACMETDDRKAVIAKWAVNGLPIF